MDTSHELVSRSGKFKIDSAEAKLALNYAGRPNIGWGYKQSQTSRKTQQIKSASCSPNQHSHGWVDFFFQFCRNISTNPVCQHSSSCLSYRLVAFWQICLVRPNCSRELNTLESVQAAHKTVSDATLPELYWAHNLLSNLHHLNWN